MLLAAFLRRVLHNGKPGPHYTRIHHACISTTASTHLTASQSTSDDDDEAPPATPWARQIISGVGLLRHSKYNKGLAFNHAERGRLYMRGLLPPAVLSQAVQAERVMMNINSKASNIDKHTYLMSLQERNESLFYYVLEKNIEQLLPLLQYKVTSEYCKKYSLMFRSLPRGLFLSLEDKGHVAAILKNWPERRIKAICMTDGERVGTFGDLGVQAIGVPISRLALYTAAGGIDPASCLPVVIDAGTDTEELLQDPIYVGSRHRRVKGDEYYELVDEFLTAVKHRYGSSVLIHFEDMAFATENKLINSYRGTFPAYSDSHFGLATTVLAGILAALPGGSQSMAEQKFLFYGESPTLTTIAELVEEAIQRESRNKTVLEARTNIWLADMHGLVVRDRKGAESLEDHKLPYIQDGPVCPDLESAVKYAKPTVLIAMSDDPPPGHITETVCREMAANTPHPIIMPLSRRNPEGDERAGEVTAKDAYTWTNGACWFADRHLTNEEEIHLPNGMVKKPRAINTVNIFPGIGLSTLIARSTRLRDDMFVEAAKALSRRVTNEDKSQGALYPPLGEVRETAAHVAAAVAAKAYHAGVATELPRSHDLLDSAHRWMYTPTYRKYR